MSSVEMLRLPLRLNARQSARGRAHSKTWRHPVSFDPVPTAGSESSALHLQNTILRYSRLQICATLPRLSVSRLLGHVFLSASLLLFPASLHAGGTVLTCTEQALRAALTGGGTVSFTNDCSITLSQPISIGANDTVITANGHNVTLSGNNTLPIFLISGNLQLMGLTLTAGRSTNGGAALVASSGRLLAYNCTFNGNTAAGQNGLSGTNGITYDNGNGADGVDGTAGGPAFGGAIYSLGNVLLSNCLFYTNFAYGGNGGSGGNGGGRGISNAGNGGDAGAGAAALGGAIYNDGGIQLLNCTLSNNAALGGLPGTNGLAGGGTFPGTDGAGAGSGAAYGGAIYSLYAVILSGCTFSGNTAQGGDSTSGGSYSNGNGRNGFRGADGSGGGLYSSYWGVVTNCTFSENNAIGGNGGNGGGSRGSNAGDGGNGGDGIGGGVYNSGGLTLVNCTVCRCGAFGGTNGVAGGGFGGADGAMGNPWGGNVANAGGTFTLMNSIVAWEAWGACGHGSFVDGGYNLLSDTSIPLTPPSFMTSAPKLALLGNNGGPTPTVAILADSPARDKIPPALAPPFDQRGFVRPQPGNGLSDIGAYEYGAVSPPPVTLVIGGSVLEGTNGLGGVSVAIGTNQVTTDATGRYSAPVTAGTYTVTPTLTRYTFQPPSASVTVPPSTTSISFQAIAGVAINLASNGVVQVSGGGSTGVTYQVQVSTNLVNWQTISTNQSPVVFTDPITNRPARFYRLQR